MIRKRLEMDFLDELRKNYRLSLEDPKEDISRETVEPIAKKIIENDIFIYKGKSLIDLKEARIRTTKVDVL